MQEVFGDRQLFWFIPISTGLGDGITFPRRGHLADADDADAEAGLLSRHGSGHRSSDELMPMMAAANNVTDDDDDDDEWSKVAIRNVGNSLKVSSFLYHLASRAFNSSKAIQNVLACRDLQLVLRDIGGSLASSTQNHHRFFFPPSG